MTSAMTALILGLEPPPPKTATGTINSMDKHVAATHTTPRTSSPGGRSPETLRRLKERRAALLRYARATDTERGMMITVTDVTKHFDVAKATATRDLMSLVESGELGVKDIGGVHIYYVRKNGHA